MIRSSNRSFIQLLRRLDRLTLRRFNILTFFFAAFFIPAICRAQFQSPGTITTRSVSGQFIVTGESRISPLGTLPDVADDTNFVRLEPALLAVSAERIKSLLWQELDVDPAAQWRGQIFLVLHPAQSLDENVTIISTPFINGWNYRVELPDVLPCSRFVRALTGVLLLEFANRDAGASLAETPSWLTDGLSQQLLAVGSSEIVLSSPNKIVNNLPVTRTDINERGFDPLAGARRTLQNQPALTFDQLSWPHDAQLSGADDGAYSASAQLLVSELMGLKNGAAKLRTMLETLPQFYNWQTAFQKAFRENFSQPLDVEKWWALRIVSFAAHDPGPRWTPAVSRDKLDEILTVPVEMRDASNSLPMHAEVPLQAVIRNFDSAQQTAILQTKLRDLGLAQLRMAPQLAVLTDAYHQTIADYLGERTVTAPAQRWFRHAPNAPKKTSAADILKKLDALDEQRRTIESAIKPDFLTP
jgi:hypothetical protein